MKPKYSFLRNFLKNCIQIYLALPQPKGFSLSTTKDRLNNINKPLPASSIK